MNRVIIDGRTVCAIPNGSKVEFGTESHIPNAPAASDFLARRFVVSAPGSGDCVDFTGAVPSGGRMEISAA